MFISNSPSPMVHLYDATTGKRSQVPMYHMSAAIQDRYSAKLRKIQEAQANNEMKSALATAMKK
jgi:hypothetical protein